MILFGVNQKIAERSRVEDENRRQQGRYEDMSLELASLKRQLQQQKQVEKMLHQQISTFRIRNEALEARNEALAAFSHAVAHNLKNPLSVVTGIAKLLENEETIKQQDRLTECLGMITQCGEKANAIIEALLLLAHIDHREIERRPLEMANLMMAVLVRLGPMIEEYQATIILPESWPEAVGYGPWVEEVWCNYLSNAIKYGGRPPRLELGATPQADGTMRFWVRDNGDGLTPAEQVKLFRPFARLQKIEIEGHGLGLSIVRRIVEKLGGQAGVESQAVPGEGCEFWFTLPFNDAGRD